jgi:hypothetical protein
MFVVICAIIRRTSVTLDSLLFSSAQEFVEGGRCGRVTEWLVRISGIRSELSVVACCLCVDCFVVLPFVFKSKEREVAQLRFVCVTCGKALLVRRWVFFCRSENMCVFRYYNWTTGFRIKCTLLHVPAFWVQTLCGLVTNCDPLGGS